MTRRRVRAALRRRLHPAGRAADAGMVTVFASLAAVGLLLMVGLVVDGGGRMRAVGRADRIATEAARAAAEAADTRGTTVTVDHADAVRAATAYLTAEGVTGTVTATGPRTVHVTVTVHGTYLILSVLGTGNYTVTGSADATLAVGVTGDAA